MCESASEYPLLACDLERMHREPLGRMNSFPCRTALRCECSILLALVSYFVIAGIVIDPIICGNSGNSFYGFSLQLCQTFFKPFDSIGDPTVFEDREAAASLTAGVTNLSVHNSMSVSTAENDCILQLQHCIIH